MRRNEMNPFFENALTELIISEKNNLDFFRLASGMVDDGGTRQVFERLAGEPWRSRTACGSYSRSFYQTDVTM
jgi:hypothetical protein